MGSLVGLFVLVLMIGMFNSGEDAEATDDNDSEIEQVENEDNELDDEGGDSEVTEEEAYVIFFDSITTMYRSYLTEIGELLSYDTIGF